MNQNSSIELEVLFRSGCPNCGGPISSARLEQGLWCPACGLERLEQEGRLTEIWRAAQHAHHLAEEFSRLTGHTPWKMQRVWLWRLVRGENFATTAPTGLGKTTFGLFAVWAVSGRRLMVMPTRLLVQQARQKLEEWSRKTGKALQLVTSLQKDGREKLADGAFDVFLTTSQFLHRNVAQFTALEFRLVFLDDVDSFLKSRRAAEKLLRVVGISPAEIEAAGQRNPAHRSLNPGSSTQLIVSSATLRPRAPVLRLFMHLLGFSLLPSSVGLRHVQDVQVPVSSREQLLEKTVALAARLPTQGVIFVSLSEGRPTMLALKERLQAAGISAALFDEMPGEVLVERFRQKTIRAIIALASPTNPILRGLDLPQNITYSIFVEVPKRVIFLEELRTPGQQYAVLVSLLRFLEEKQPALRFLRQLKRYRYWPAELVARNEQASQLVAEVNAFLRELLSDRQLVSRVRQAKEILLRIEADRVGFVLPDATAYIQGSGRTSRVLGNHLTFGLSFLVYQDEKAFAVLQRRLRILFPFLDGNLFRPLDALDWQWALQEIEQSRRPEAAGTELTHQTTLMLVESPAKARTIASFFGQPSSRRLGEGLLYEVASPGETLTVTASVGHLYDLVTREGFFGVQVNHRFVPIYDSLKICPETGEKFTDQEIARQRCPRFRDRQEFIRQLHPLLQEMDRVLIATDPDAEGEKIAWDLYVMLRPLHREIYRVEFHEVTPQAIRRAMSEKRSLFRERVAAQLVRRISDRWVGFALSQHLWQVFQHTFLSAGRVQTPVLGWVIERSQQARQKVALFRYRLNDIPQEFRVEDLQLAGQLAEHWTQVRAHFLGEEVREQHPAPPFTTDVLLEQANRRLRLPAAETMKLLQQLFEKGLITYHRTDSTTVSVFGQQQVARPLIEERFGRDWFVPRSYGRAEGGAHECIRPTRPLWPEDLQEALYLGSLQLENPRGAVSLYRLIFLRFLASQMPPARLRFWRYELEWDSLRWQAEIPVELVAEGFYRLLGPPALARGEDPHQPRLQLETWEKIPARYPFTEGALIAEMKARGLGRPSTYAIIVQTLLNRRYVVRRKQFLVPTRQGREVFAYLQQAYPELIQESFTRELEAAMDQVANGEADWQEILRTLYQKVRTIPRAEVPIPSLDDQLQI